MLKFNNRNDRFRGVSWVKEQLSDYRQRIQNIGDADIRDDIESQIDLFLDDLASFLHGVPIELDFEDQWLKFLHILNIEYRQRRERPDPVWGEWRLEQGETLDYGYLENYLKGSVISEGGVIKINEYREIPPPMKWRIHKITQKKLTFYTCMANVDQVEQACAVPSLPDEISSIEAGLRVLDRTRKEDEWQRSLNPKRMQAIRNFIDFEENIVANSPILFVKNREAVTINEEDGYIEIDLSRFLVSTKSGTYVDIETVYDTDTRSIVYQDHRPIWLIDGQHRVRGISRSKKSYNLQIPVTIFPINFTLSGAAKIFAEINTLQESLDSLHTLFMQHRFSIPSPNKKRDFTPWTDNPAGHRESRANNLSYELLAKLASEEDGALRDKVQILEQNPPKISLFKADQWVNYARNWFISEPYDDISLYDEENLDEIYREVNLYFWALIATCNHGKWPDGKPRWSDTSAGRGLIQQKTHFQVLIEIYSLVRHLAQVQAGTGDRIEQKHFMKALKPLYWVDWTDRNLLTTFGGGGEKGRKCLQIWMEDALKEGVRHDWSKVMSERIHSKPGKGILSSPSDCTIENETIDLTWPISSKSGFIALRSKRPKNAMRTARWMVLDSNGTDRSPEKHATGTDPDEFARFKIEHQDWMDTVKSFEVRVDWQNAVDPKGHAKISFKQPSS